MNKIKVVDLLNMINKGEELPKKIRLFGEEFKIKDNEYYSVHTSNPLISYFGEDYLRAELNDEVEILDEEEFEDIEEITIRDKIIGFPNGEWTARNMDKAFSIKINQLIKNQKKIIEKLNKEN